MIPMIFATNCLELLEEEMINHALPKGKIVEGGKRPNETQDLDILRIQRPMLLD
jgi:hypothetical protein